MKARNIYAVLFILLAFCRPAGAAWEKLCTLEGNGVSSKVSFLAMSIYRQSGQNGNWDYKIEFPVGVGDRCSIPGQYPTGKVTAKFFMTKNKIFEDNKKFYKGNKTFSATFTGENYYDCIGGDYSTGYDCSF